jgi:hypothetical protein
MSIDRRLNLWADIASLILDSLGVSFSGGEFAGGRRVPAAPFGPAASSNLLPFR